MKLPLSKAARATALAAILLATTTHSQAIGIRSDGKYQAGFSPFYDSDSVYANVVNIMQYAHQGHGEYRFGNHCTGTLINSRTILTAAHCVVTDDGDTNLDMADVDPSKNGARNFGISFKADAGKNGETREQTVYGFENNDDESLISGFIAHEAYGPGTAAGGETNNSHDIAIISLDKPITEIAPAQLLQEMPNVGEEIILVGYGAAGAINFDVKGPPGDQEPSLSDDKRRTGGNYLESVAPLTPDLVNELTNGNPAMMRDMELGQPMLIFDSDDPANPRDWLRDRDEPGDRVHAEEATTAPGDSGGPIFVERNGVRYLVGLSNSGGPRDPSSYDGGYANIIFHVPVASHLDWINKNNPLKEVTAKAGTWSWSNLEAWSDVNTINGMQSMMPHNTSTTACNAGENGFCKHSTYFNATLDKSTRLTIDGNVTIDKLTLSHNEAVASLLANQTLETVVETDVRNGQFRMNSGSTLDTENLNIHQGASLVAHGTVDGNLNSRGTISLIQGDAETVGKLHVTEDINLDQNSKLQIRMNKDGQSDWLSSPGSVTVNQAVVEIVPSKGLGGGVHRQNILYSQVDPIAGGFASVHSTSVFYKAALTSANNNQIIGVELKRDVAGATRLTKEKTIINLLTTGLDKNDSRVEELFDLIQNVSEDKLDATLKSLNGDVYSNNNTAMLGSLNAISNVLAQLRTSTGSGSNSGNSSSFVRSYTAKAEKSEASKALEDFTQLDEIENQGNYWSVWGKFLAGRGFYDGSNGAANTTTNTFGFLGGGFYTFDDQSVLGAYGGFTETSSSQASNSLKVQGITLGLNGETSVGDYTFGGYLQYSHQTFDASRTVLAGGTSTAKSKYDGHVFSGSLEVSRAFQVLETMKFSPFTGLEVHHSRLDAFTETGAGAANLSVAARNDTIVFSNIGGRIEQSFEVKGATLTPQLSLGWRAELTNPNGSQTANLAGQTLEIKSKGKSRHALAVGFGLKAELDKGPIIETRYDGNLSSSFQDHQASFRLTLPLN